MSTSWEDVSQLPLIRRLINSTWYTGYISVSNTIYPNTFIKYLDIMKTFKVHDDDIWITSVPKSGTTWVQEMVWSIMNIGNEDYKVKGSESVRFRVPMVEQIAWSTIENPSTFDIVDALKQPRMIKSHLSYNLLPDEIRVKKPKIIHIARNPRDVCVSFYHFSKIFIGYTGTFEEMVELFVNDMIGFGSPFLAGVLTYWERREEENILFITYEEMKMNLSMVIKRVANFLGKELTEEDLESLTEHLTFESMADDPSCNLTEFVQYVLGNHTHVKAVPQDAKFLRKGVIGDWKNYFDEGMKEQFEVWEEKWLKGSGLEFVFEESG